jgi:hypothetical protein
VLCAPPCLLALAPRRLSCCSRSSPSKLAGVSKKLATEALVNGDRKYNGALHECCHIFKDQ